MKAATESKGVGVVLHNDVMILRTLACLLMVQFLNMLVGLRKFSQSTRNMWP